MSPELPPMALLDATGSTSDLALQAAADGAPHGSCWLADHQLHGRGRREVGGARRLWHSPPGRNLYLSILLRPGLGATAASGLTLAAAAAACHVVRRLGEVDAWVKWPNDLWVGERKLAGILTEATAQGAELVVVVGLGLNVNLGAEELPDRLKAVATSLRMITGREHDRLALALALRAEVVTWAGRLVVEGLGPVIEALRPLERSAGRRVELSNGRRGTSAGIDDRGHLRVALEGEGGREISVQTGEVRLV